MRPERSPVLAGHHPLDGLQQGRADAAVILEPLAAAVDPDPCARADMLVIRAPVVILKPAPAADVIDEDWLEVGLAGSDLGPEGPEFLSMPGALAGRLWLASVGALDKERAEREAFDRLKAEPNRAFVASEDSYKPLTAAEVNARNRT